MRETLYRKRWHPAESFLLAAVYGAASASVALFLGIAGYVFVRGAPAVNLEFLTSVTSELRQTTGIAGNLVNTLYMVVMTLLAAVPVGVGAAVYINEYAKPGIMVDLIEFTAETLAGIPSILYGLFGMAFFGETLHLDYSLLRGALTLSLMVLPLILRNTQEALRRVPESYRNGALGMGASRWHMIRTVLLPSAMPGIITGVILAAGRIVGESAALLFTAGSGRLLPRLGGSLAENLEALGARIWESGGTLTTELYLQMQNGRYDAAFGTGGVLIVIVLLINLLTKLVERICGGFPIRK
ncbi:MAG: phosphate ABC transporter permease PstA [Blautia sp.]|nr:phosphate ABC transporter permease PstA [Blautia sp.]